MSASWIWCVRSPSIFCCPRTFLACFPLLEDVWLEPVCGWLDFDFVLALFETVLFDWLAVEEFPVVLLLGALCVEGVEAVWPKASEAVRMAFAATPNPRPNHTQARLIPNLFLHQKISSNLSS